MPSSRSAARDVSRLRLEAQGVAWSGFREPHEVVEALGAVQAQDYLGALWAVGLRLPHASEADVERAVARRTILRTWPMRGTLHLVPARDARWMLRLAAERMVARAAGRHRELGLDAPTFSASRRLLVRALEGGRRLTRPAAFAVLQAGGVSTEGQRGIHILQRLAWDGLLCFGPREGKQHTFVLLDEWVPSARTLERDEALAELAARYFAGHGPATAADFAWWTGLPAAEVRSALELAGARLERERIDGRVHFSAPLGRGRAGGGRTGAVLLPPFDELVVGYTDRSALFDPAQGGEFALGRNGMLSPIVLLRGRAVGTWKRTLSREGVAVAPALLVPVDGPGWRAVTDASRRYAAFLGVPLAGVAAPGVPQRRRTPASRLKRPAPRAAMKRKAKQ